MACGYIMLVPLPSPHLTSGVSCFITGHCVHVDMYAKVEVLNIYTCIRMCEPAWWCSVCVCVHVDMYAYA